MPQLRKGDLIGLALQDFLTKAGQGISTGIGQAQQQNEIRNLISGGQDPFTLQNLPALSRLNEGNQGLVNLVSQREEARRKATQPDFFNLGKGQTRYQRDPVTGEITPVAFGGEDEQKLPNPQPRPAFEGPNGNRWVEFFDPAAQKFVQQDTGVKWVRPPKDSSGSRPTVPSSADASFIANHGLLLKSVTEIEGTLKAAKEWEGWVGPIAGRAADLKSAANALPAEQERFRATVAEIRNKFLNVLSGAAISPAEAERLMEQLPTTTDSPTAFREKVKKTKENIEFLLSEYKKTRRLGESGGEQFDVGEVYIDASGNRARYLGNGNWEDQ